MQWLPNCTNVTSKYVWLSRIIVHLLFCCFNSRYSLLVTLTSTSLVSLFYPLFIQLRAFNTSVLSGYAPISRVKYTSLKIIPTFLWPGLTPTLKHPSLMSFLQLPTTSPIFFNIQNISCIAIHKSWFLHLSTMFPPLPRLVFPNQTIIIQVSFK